MEMETTTRRKSVIVFLSRAKSLRHLLYAMNFFLFQGIMSCCLQHKTGESLWRIMSETIILLCVLFSRNHTTIIFSGMFIGFVWLRGFVQTIFCQLYFPSLSDDSYATINVQISFPDHPKLNDNHKYEWKTLESTQLTIVRKPQIRNHDDVMETERFDGERKWGLHDDINRL